MVLRAYIDGSGSYGQPVLVMAGYIATDEQWGLFAHEWAEVLKEAGRPYFKMAEMISQPEIAAYFYRIAEKHVTAGLACAVPCEPLKRVVSDLGLPRGALENPYFFALKAIINVTAQHQIKMGLREPINFVFDDQSEKSMARSLWDAYIGGLITPDVRALTGAEPVFLNDVDHPPLQAADLYAWWMRKAWQTGGIEEFLKERLPFPWTPRREFPRFLIACDEDDIRTELAKVRHLMIEAGKMPSVRVTVTFSTLSDGNGSSI